MSQRTFRQLHVSYYLEKTNTKAKKRTKTKKVGRDACTGRFISVKDSTNQKCPTNRPSAK